MTWLWTHGRLVIFALCSTVIAPLSACSTDKATDDGAASQERAPAVAALSGSKLSGVTLSLLKKAFNDAAARQAMIQRLMDADLDDAPLLHELLHRKTDISPVDLKNVLRTIGAAVPDRDGRFTGPTPKQVDWLKALLKLDRSQLSPRLQKAYAENLLTVTLIRALANTRHQDAAISLVRFGFRNRGAFRDECGTWIRAMGLHAVPGLLRVRVLRDPLAFKMIRYAKYQLDRLNCTRPDRVLRDAAPDLRAALLHAYGEVRDPAAVSQVLKYVNSDVVQVREAARWALLRYVSGRPPKAVKRKLKLAGGRETEQARSVYMTYRQLATRQLANTLARLKASRTGRSEKDLRKAYLAEMEPRHMAEKLLALYDQDRQDAQKKRLRAAIDLGNEGKLKQALSQFDRFLAINPYHPHRAIMAPFYLRQGQQLLKAGKKEAACLLFTKAAHLAPNQEVGKQARAARLYAEALLSDPRSVQREWKLEDAISLSTRSPLKPAGRALDKIQQDRRQRIYMAGGLSSALVFGLLLGITFLWRRLTPR